MELPTLYPQTAKSAAKSLLFLERSKGSEELPASMVPGPVSSLSNASPQWAWPRCCSAQFISCYSVSNLWGVFVKLSQRDQRLLPETHTSQKSQGGIMNLLSRMKAVFLHQTLQDPLFICPQSHAQWLLQIPAGGWKQMAARDRVGAQSCLAHGIQGLHSLTGPRMLLCMIKSWGVGFWGLRSCRENSGDIGSK